MNLESIMYVEIEMDITGFIDRYKEKKLILQVNWMIKIDSRHFFNSRSVEDNSSLLMRKEFT